MSVWVEQHLLLIVLTAALSANVLLTLYLAVRLFQIMRTVATTERSLTGLRADIGALCEGAVGVGKRLARVEETLRYQGERQNQLELRESSSDRAYEHAVRLARNGAGLNDLVSTCALSHGEAELLLMMHRYDTAPERG